jgi:hypothetical protein
MKLRVFKAAGCEEVDDETLRLLVKFVQYVSSELNLQDVEIKIRLLGKSPNEPITTGAYQPDTKTISTIATGRNPIDYFRTISHEMVHLRQDIDGQIKGPQQEIGGEIEDRANILSGRFCKHFIKNIMTKDQKQYLGLGTYGS